MSNRLIGQSSLKDGDVIGVVDDIPDDAEMTIDLLVEAGFQPVFVELEADAEVLIERLRASVRAVVCDHRLRQKVHYSGAEVVARCMSVQLPAVLITTYANTADSASIQRFKASIPEVLRRGSGSSPKALRLALDVANKETQGEYTAERKPYRTVVRVASLEDADQTYAEVFVSAWSPDEALRIPLEIITGETGVPADGIVGRRFLADVNIYARSADEVYLKNFEVLPEPPADWMAT